MTKLLYKYRDITNFKNFVDIILNQRLYAAKYLDLNDPMEGRYEYFDNQLNYNTRETLLYQKQELKICALSTSRDEPLLWSHYSNGHRGVVIGVTVLEDKSDIVKIKYIGPKTVNQKSFNGQTAKQILTRKLSYWAYEKEVRVFVTHSEFVKVNVEEIIIGRWMNPTDKQMIRALVGKIKPDIKITEFTEHDFG